MNLASFNLLHSQTEVSDNNKETTALILIDIQEFYFPEGMLPLVEPEIAAKKASIVLDYFRKNEMNIIHIKHVAKSGSAIHKLVKPIEGEKVIEKTKANSFVNTELQEYLKSKNIKNLVLCGMQTHMCLEATTRAASDYGYNCTVVEDACTTRDLNYNEITISAKDVHYSTLSTLNKTYASILTAEELIKNLK